MNFLNLAPDSQWLIMVREPIQSCEAWIRKQYIDGDYHSVAIGISQMLYEIDNSVYSRQHSVGVRLEDLKNKPRETIKSPSKFRLFDFSLCFTMTLEYEIAKYLLKLKSNVGYIFFI